MTQLHRHSAADNTLQVTFQTQLKSEPKFCQKHLILSLKVTRILNASIVDIRLKLSSLQKSFDQVDSGQEDQDQHPHQERPGPEVRQDEQIANVCTFLLIFALLFMISLLLKVLKNTESRILSSTKWSLFLITVSSAIVRCC